MNADKLSFACQLQTNNISVYSRSVYLQIHLVCDRLPFNTWIYRVYCLFHITAIMSHLVRFKSKHSPEFIICILSVQFIIFLRASSFFYITTSNL